MLIDGFTLFGSWPGLPYEHQVEELVSGLGRFRVDRACTLSTQGIFLDAAMGNQTTWSVCHQTPSLIPIGVADPRMAGIEQVEYCQTQGFGLMALFPVSQEWSIASLSAKQVLHRIAEANLPVLIEAGRDGDPSAVFAAVQDFQMPIILLDVSLRTVTEAITLVKERPNTYLSTRLLCGGDTVEYLIEAIGVDRLIFSSRFPVSCFSSAYLTAKFANISPEDQAAVLGGNMAKLLKLGAAA